MTNPLSESLVSYLVCILKLTQGTVMAYASKERIDSLQRRLVACEKKIKEANNPSVKQIRVDNLVNLAMEMLLVIRMSNKE